MRAPRRETTGFDFQRGHPDSSEEIDRQAGAGQGGIVSAKGFDLAGRQASEQPSVERLAPRSPADDLRNE